jgi:squalene synthase HpnC
MGMDSAAEHIKSKLRDSIHGSHLRESSRSLELAYRYCERLARSHYENFPVGSLFIPSNLRRHVYAIYAFARTADDFADEEYSSGHTENERLVLLEQWRAMLEDSFSGKVDHPVFIALDHTRRCFDLTIEPFEDLLSAFIQDVTSRRYSDQAALIDYCRRSANPIGRLMLLLFGYREAQLHEWSDMICTGLQLTNHWQDVRVDLAKDRIYLPLEDLERFGVSVDQLRLSHSTDGLRDLMAYEVARTREMFVSGRPLCLHARGRLGMELRAIWLGGWRILERIEENRYDVLANRPVLTHADKLRVIAMSVRKESFRRFNG